MPLDLIAQFSYLYLNRVCKEDMNDIIGKSKFVSTTSDDVRESIKDELDQMRKTRRSCQLDTRRFGDQKKYNTTGDFSQQKIKAVAEKFRKQTKSTEDELKFLRQASLVKYDFIKIFLEVDNALYKLVGYLTCRNSTLQIEAALLITNITAVDENNFMKVSKACAPYLITFLQGGSSLMQEQCALSLGNLASNGIEACTLLEKQGAVSVLVTVVKNKEANLITSALYALVKLSRFGGNDIRSFILIELHMVLFQLLCDHSTPEKCIGEVGWLVVHLLRGKAAVDLLISHDDWIPHLYFWIMKIEHTRELDCFILTPLLRCLGNLINFTDIPSKEVSAILCTLKNILRKSRRNYLLKETLWVLSNLLSLCYDNPETVETQILCDVINETTQLVHRQEAITKEVLACWHNMLAYPQIHSYLLSDDIVNNILQLIRQPINPAITILTLRFLYNLFNVIGEDSVRIFLAKNVLMLLDSFSPNDEDLYILSKQLVGIMSKYSMEND